MRSALSLVALCALLGAAPAAACLNDAFTGEEERQFRSRYADERPAARVEATTGALGALGAAALVGAIGVAVRRWRRAA